MRTLRQRIALNSLNERSVARLCWAKTTFEERWSSRRAAPASDRGPPPEVDEDVAAEDRVELVERAVGGEVVLGEDHVRGEVVVEARRARLGRVVGRELL